MPLNVPVAADTAQLSHHIAQSERHPLVPPYSGHGWGRPVHMLTVVLSGQSLGHSPTTRQQVDTPALILGRLGGVPTPAVPLELCGCGQGSGAAWGSAHPAGEGKPGWAGHGRGRLPPLPARSAVPQLLGWSWGWRWHGGPHIQSETGGVCCLISALTGAGTRARAQSGTERETRPVPLSAWPTSSQGS